MSDKIKKVSCIVVLCLAAILMCCLVVRIWNVLSFGLATGGGLMWWCFAISLVLSLLASAIIVCSLCLWSVCFDRQEE